MPKPIARDLTGTSDAAALSWREFFVRLGNGTLQGAARLDGRDDRNTVASPM